MDVNSVLVVEGPPVPIRPGAAMNAFLVRCDHFLVFLTDDPRSGGLPLPVEQEVLLDDDTVYDSGPMPSGVCVGQNPKNARHYRVFRSEPGRARAGFRQTVGMPVIVPTWGDFLQIASDCGELVG
jgi:hypothetical protein